MGKSVLYALIHYANVYIIQRWTRLKPVSQSSRSQNSEAQGSGSQTSGTLRDIRIPDLRSPELGNLHDSGSQNLLKLPIWITEAHILAKEAKVRSKDRTQPCTLQYGMQALQVAWCSDDCATPPPPEIANTGVFFPLPSTSLLLRKRQFTVYTVCVMCSCLEPEVLAAGEETTFLF